MFNYFAECSSPAGNGWAFCRQIIYGKQMNWPARKQLCREQWNLCKQANDVQGMDVWKVRFIEACRMENKFKTKQNTDESN